MNTKNYQIYLKPLVHTGKGFYAIFVFLTLSVVILITLYARLITEGHHITGLSPSQGASWGITVANIIQIIAISHVGIAISAFVRILNLERYKYYARIAELVTIVALPTAVLNIGLDVGRPERFIINVFWYGRWHSPMVWSMTVISLYLVASSVYLYLAVRRDLALCAERIPRRRWFYRLLALGYTDTEEERRRHKKVLWWLALIILPIMISVHSVYGMIFGVIGAKHGWFNPLQAPYFVLGAIVSGFSTIILIAVILRKIYGWQKFFPPLTFRRLGILLGFVTFIYIYFYTSELVVGVFGWPKGEHQLMMSMLYGPFSRLFWPNYILGYFLPFGILFVVFVSKMWKPILSITPIAVAAALLLFATWVGRFLIVVPTYYQPHLPYRIVPYTPTTFEWAVTLLTYGFLAFFYLVLIKIIPVLEFPEGPAPEVSQDSILRLPLQEMPENLKRLLLSLTIVLGMTLVVLGLYWGITGPDRPMGGASATWVFGGIILVGALPFLTCLIRPKLKASES
ncbi:MAG: NrfD/PsrC family molybdoenzyme membrane anchor subunit [Candidatus Methanofastidiosia archaeon]